MERGREMDSVMGIFTLRERDIIRMERVVWRDLGQYGREIGKGRLENIERAIVIRLISSRGRQKALM